MNLSRTIVFICILLLLLAFGCTYQSSEVAIDLIDYYCGDGQSGGSSHAAKTVSCMERVTLHKTSKSAFTFNRPGEFDLFVRCPAKATHMDLWIGIIGDTSFDNVADGRLDFSVALATDSSKVASEFRIGPRLDYLRDHWFPVTINLVDYADEIIRIRFAWRTGGDEKGYKLVLGSPVIMAKKDVQGTSGSDSDKVVSIKPQTIAPYRNDNLILILVDTLRADSTGFGGHPKVKTPHLDRLTKSGIVFPHTLSSSSWTRPAVGTLFTGTIPLVHQAMNRKDKLSYNVPTLAENFKVSGFKTYGYIGNGNVSTIYGFGRGFDHYQFVSAKDMKLQAKTIIKIGTAGRHVPFDHPKNLDSPITTLVNKTIHRESKNRFFMYIHYCHPHIPYVPVMNYYDPDYDGEVTGHKNSLLKLRSLGDKREISDMAHIENLYLSEITDTDHEIGTIIQRLHNSGILNKTVLLFVSDHGDEFYEHGEFSHGRTLYQEVVHVPFFISPPRWTQGPIIHDGQTKLSDIFPTVGDMFGLPQQGKFVTGVSLFQKKASYNCNTSQGRQAKPLLLHLDLDDRQGNACLIDNYKLIIMKNNDPELYEQREYVNEQRNLAPSLPVRTGYYSYLLDKELARIDRLQAKVNSSRELKSAIVDEQELPEEVRENLKALGYIQ